MKPIQNTKLQLFLGLFLLLTFVISNAQTKKLIFSNNGEQVDIQGNASINVATGDITVQTMGNKTVVDADDPAFLDFYLSEPYYVTGYPGSVEVNWTAINASNCTASVPAGNAPSWISNPSKTIGPDNKQTVTVNTDGTKLQLSCTGKYGGPNAVKQLSISKQSTGNNSGPGSAPVINTFVIQNHSNGSLTSIGAQYTFLWSVSNLGGGSCQLSNNDPINNQGIGWGSVSTNGQGQGQSTVTINTSLVATLYCSNGDGSDTKTFSATFGGNNGGNQPLACQNLNIQEPTGITRETYDFTQPRNGAIDPAIPGQNGAGGEVYAGTGTVLFAVKPQYTFASIGNINIPNNSQTQYLKNGEFEWSFWLNDASTRTGNFDKIIFSLSQCAGDFDTNKSAVCSGSINKGTYIYMTTKSDNPHLNLDIVCPVEKGRSYYLNLLAGQDGKGLTPIHNKSLQRCAENNPYKGKCGTMVNVAPWSY